MAGGFFIYVVREALIKSQNTLSCHSGACQNLVKTITYWMLVFTSMTIKILNQSFLNWVSSWTKYVQAQSSQ